MSVQNNPEEKGIFKLISGDEVISSLQKILHTLAGKVEASCGHPGLSMEDRCYLAYIFTDLRMLADNREGILALMKSEAAKMTVTDELISICEELSAVLISQDSTIFNLFEDGDLGQFEGTYELSWQELIAAIKDPDNDNLGGYEGEDIPAHVQLYRRAQAVIAKAREGGEII